MVLFLENTSIGMILEVIYLLLILKPLSVDGETY